MLKFFPSIAVALLISCCDDPLPENPTDSYNLDVLWEMQYENNGWGADAPPASINDSLLLYTGNDNISCINIDSGSLKWTSSLEHAGSVLKRFIFDESNVFGFRRGNNIYSLDISDGTTIWEKDIDSCQSFSFELSIDQEHYFVGISSHKVNSPYSIQKYSKSGFLVDSTPTNHMPWILSSSDNKLFCSQGWSPAGNPNDIGQIICFDVTSMDTLWYYEGGGSFIHYPIFKDGIMYAGTVWGANNKILALNTETGEVIWETGSYGCYQIELVGDTIYYGGGGSVSALDKNTGQVLWRTVIPTTDESSPLTYLDGFVYKSHAGSLYILDATTGEVVHTMRGPDNASVEQVSTGAGKIFVQSTQHLYAFSPYDPEKDHDN